MTLGKSRHNAMRTNHHGFSFIEVLVALLIVGIGVAALVSLQSTFIRGTALASERNAALDIAQNQIERLRATPYADIADGAESIDQSLQNFDVTWAVTPYYYVDTGAGATWLAATDPSLPASYSAAPVPTAHAKAVAVQVSWQARGNNTEQITVPAWFSALQLRDGQSALQTPTERADPQVVYTPGAAPEVIAIKLEEDSAAEAFFVKETSKPTPQVSRDGDYLQVSFDAVTYDEETQTQRIEDFLTLNCSCTLQGSGEGATPNRMALIDGELQLDDTASEFINKTVGVSADSSQPALCNQCCRDHHDSQEMVAEGNVYQQTDDRTPDGNHRHYREVNGSLIEAGVGDNYLEACRLRRVDGYYAPFADWQLGSVALMSANFLTTADSASVYEAYIQDSVRAMVTNTSLPQAPAGRDLNVTSGAYQLIGRGLYLDEMAPEHEQLVLDKITAGDTDWLKLVPFYEVNVTLLADWESSNAAVAAVTDEPIETIVDPENDYYGTYSRGRMQAQQSGTAQVTMAVLGANAGIIGSAATKPSDSDLLFSDQISVTVSAQSENTTFYAVTGEVNCLDVVGAGCKNNQLRDVDVSTSDLNITCSYQTGGRNQTPFYSCANIPAGWSGIIYFNKDGFNFTPSQLVIDNLNQNQQSNIFMQEG